MNVCITFNRFLFLADFRSIVQYFSTRYSISLKAVSRAHQLLLAWMNVEWYTWNTMPGLLARCWKYQNWNLFTYTQSPESRVQNPESRVQSPVHVLAYVFFKKMHILIYIGICVHHTHVIFLVSVKLALSSQNELQMFSLITGRHIGKWLLRTKPFLSCVKSFNK